MKHFFSTVLLFLMISICPAQEFQEIIESMKQGDGISLVAYMNAEVELSIDSERSTLDRNAAGKRLVAFFHQNPVKSFEVVHKGTTKDAGVNQSHLQYLICQLQCEEKSFRTSFYIRVEGSEYRIESMEIDES